MTDKQEETTLPADFTVDYPTYACGRCGGHTGMYGHYTSAHYANGRWVRVMGHQCCPNNCELKQGDKHE